MSFVLTLPIVLLSVLFVAFLAGAETVLISADRTKIKHGLTTKKSRKYEMVYNLITRPEKALITILIGINLSVVLGTTFLTSAFISYTKYKPEIAVIIITGLVLFFGEIIPKTIAIQKADTYIFKIRKPIFWVSSILFPITFIVEHLAKIILHLLKVKNFTEMESFTREELKSIITQTEIGIIKEDEKKMLARVFDFSETTAREVMIPLSSVSAVEKSETIESVLKIILEKGYSRVPVFDGRIDNIIGVVHAFDLIYNPAPEGSVSARLRKILIAPEARRVDDLLADLQKEKKELAVIVDEYGAAVGIVTVEDMLEEIVGEIHDEYDMEISHIIRVGENIYLIDAKMEVDMLNDKLSLSIPKGDYETVGGFVIEFLTKIPKAGEVLTYKNLKFEIISADEKRIHRLKLHIEEKQEED